MATTLTTYVCLSIAHQTRFALRLMFDISSNPELASSNVAFSPVSLHVALSLITINRATLGSNRPRPTFQQNFKVTTKPSPYTMLLFNACARISPYHSQDCSAGPLALPLSLAMLASSLAII